MSISETLIGINSAALDTPLNHIIWLNDYKTFGKNSYVAVDTDKYNELMSDYILSMNDPVILADALNFAISRNEFGKAISKYKKISDLTIYNGIVTFEDLVSQRDALATTFSDNILATALMRSGDFISALYANPANTDVVLTSDVIDYISNYKETISSTITVEEPMYIINITCDVGSQTIDAGDYGYRYYSCIAGGEYTGINDESVIVNTASGNYGSNVPYTKISKNVNSLGKKIVLTAGTYTNCSSTSTANIVRLPVVE